MLADVSDDGGREDRAEALIGRIRTMAFRMGLPDQLEDVTAEQAAQIAELTAEAANPRYISPVVWTAEECHDLILSLCAEPSEEEE